MSVSQMWVTIPNHAFTFGPKAQNGEPKLRLQCARTNTRLNKNHTVPVRNMMQKHAENLVRLSLERYFITMAHNPFAFVSAPQEMKSVRQTPVGAQQWSQKHMALGPTSQHISEPLSHLLQPFGTFRNALQFYDVIDLRESIQH